MKTTTKNIIKILLIASSLMIYSCGEKKQTDTFTDDEEKKTSTITDIDGNAYNIVQIGDQWWMAENLRVTKYRNGDAIPTGLSNTDWRNTSSGAYAIYPHSEIEGLDSNEKVVAAYGKLYNWYAVDDLRGLCPEGWNVPSDEEWTMLTDYLDGLANNKLCKMKSTRTEPDLHPRWDSPNTGATNESGFSGLPGGYRRLGRHSGVYFAGIGEFGMWWSSTEYPIDHAWNRGLLYDFSHVGRLYFNKRDGFSIRCLMDE